MNRHTRQQSPWFRTAAGLAIIFVLAAAPGCRHIEKAPQPSPSQATAAYALACKGMATAGTTDEFAAALSAMEGRARLDFSREDPTPLIDALRHGIYLMKKVKKEEKAASRRADQCRQKQKQLEQTIRSLTKKVDTLKHQISILENIDQERREKEEHPMKAQAKVLIVDDDSGILDVLEARLEAAGFKVFKAGSATGAARILKSEAMDLMVSDVKMPRKSGTDLFREIREGRINGVPSDLPVIFLTAYGTIPDAVEAIKLGAADYISKPFDGRELIAKIDEILAARSKGAAATAAKGPGSLPNDFIWGKSPAMAALYPVIQKVAATPVNVLLLGESGVGKERIAALIHSLSHRHSRPYVVVDCGSTPPGTLESELFGHLKGAFTHAVKDKKGLIETADTGTLFLDEIGNISHDMQCRLLRFLEEGKIRQVGAVAEKKVDARVIAATNADLGRAIEAGTFRQDLYYRLKGITLTLPALRERKPDIPELAAFFVNQYVTAQNLAPVRISRSAMAVLEDHPWPGNIRELKNCLEAGVILCRENTIRPSDLQLEPIREQPAAQSPGPEGFSIEESEKNTIIRALKETRGVQKTAADLLNISKRAIHYKIKKYGIRPAAYK